MKAIDSIEGDSPSDTILLRRMANEAREFVSNQEWCEHVDHAYLAFGIGGVVAVFLFEITPHFEEVDSSLWVIVGDLPPAYIVVDGNPTALDALDAYCSEMERWINAVENGESVKDLIPVNAPPTQECSMQLKGRIAFLRSKILPLTTPRERLQ